MTRGKGFKGGLCLAGIPEERFGGNWTGLTFRHHYCQRRAVCDGRPHRSWSREWNKGDMESRARKDKR